MKWNRLRRPVVQKRSNPETMKCFSTCHFTNAPSTNRMSLAERVSRSQLKNDYLFVRWKFERPRIQRIYRLANHTRTQSVIIHWLDSILSNNNRKYVIWMLYAHMFVCLFGCQKKLNYAINYGSSSRQQFKTKRTIHSHNKKRGGHLSHHRPNFTGIADGGKISSILLGFNRTFGLVNWSRGFIRKQR